MYQFPRTVVASILVMVSLFANAQDSINKGDLPDPRSSIDQNPVSVGDSNMVDLSMPAQSGRTKISNASSIAADSSAALKTPSKAREITNRSAPQHVLENEFQKFIFETTGHRLPIFGAEFFVNSPSTFAPILNSPVPSDYVVGPGDEIIIRGWGSIDIDYRATIDRNGVVTLPTIGTIILVGVKANDVESVVKAAVSRLFKGVSLTVTFGQLRAVTIYVVGQASRPGSYTVSNMSTLITAVFASGGPNSFGTVRRIQLKRAGKIATELDLYSFIAKGDKSADIKLQDGDTVYFPPAIGHVALTGKVNSPGIYELRTAGDTIASILEYAGGVPVVADPRRAFLERIDPQKSQPRSVEEFALNSDAIKKTFKNGDILNVSSITPDFSNAVILRGNVDQPIRAAFVQGMRITDLIPNKEYLISRSAVKRQNSGFNNPEGETVDSIAFKIGGIMDEINWEYAVIERINRKDLTSSLIPFNLGEIFANPASAANVLLQPGDTVTIFSQKDVSVPLEKRRVFVRIEGEVNVPGVYQMTPGETIQNLLAKAGGPTRNAFLFGTAFYREQVRIEQQANLEKAVDRLESQLRLEQAKGIVDFRGQTEGDAKIFEMKRQAELSTARETIQRIRKLTATGRVLFGLDPAERSFNKLPNLKVENGDRMVIPFRPEFVHIFGAVNSEVSPIWKRELVLGDYLKKAGLRPEADLDAVFVIRVDGSIMNGENQGWILSSVNNISVQPGDTIVIPEKNYAKESVWSKFTSGAKEWTQILANFGLGAAAIKVLK